MSGRMDEVKKVLYKKQEETKVSSAVASKRMTEVKKYTQNLGKVQEINKEKNRQQVKMTYPAANDNAQEQELAVKSEMGEAIRTRNSMTPVGTAASMARISELQLQEAELKMNQNAQKVQDLQLQETQLQKKLSGLESAKKGLDDLLAEYQQTGSDVTAKAYQIAMTEYNQMLTAYEKEYGQYQKDAKAYDDYAASILKYEKTYAGYEKNYAKYAEEYDKYTGPGSAQYEERIRQIADLEANLSVEELEKRRTAANAGVQAIYDDPDYYAKREIYQNAVAEGRMSKEELDALNPDKERDRLLAQAEEYTRRIEQKQTEDWIAANKDEIRAAGGEELMADLMELARLQAVAKEKTGQAAGGGSTTMDTEELIAATELNGKLKALYGDRVDKWMEYATWVYEQQAYENTVTEMTELQKTAPLAAAIGATAVTTPIQKLVGGTLGLVSVAGQRLEKELTGSQSPVNFKNKWTSINASADEARKIISDRIEKKTEGWMGSDTTMGNIYSGTFNLGMSMADSGVVIGLTALGLPPMVGTSLLGGAAATTSMTDAIEKGATADQALYIGALTGFAEAFFEHFSVEKIVKMQDAKGISNLLKSMLVQGGVEASEEGATTLANTLADMIILGDLSQLEISKKNYIENGYSEEDAERMAVQNWVLGLGSDLIGGFVSGFLFGAGGASVNALSQRYDYKKGGKVIKKANAVEALIDEGLAAHPKSDAYGMAKKLQEKLNDGKKLSAIEVGKLMYANQEAINAGLLVNEKENEQVQTVAQEPRTVFETVTQEVPAAETETEIPGLTWAGTEKMEGDNNHGAEEQRDLGAGRDQERQRGYEAQRHAESQKRIGLDHSERRAKEAGRIRSYANARQISRQSLRELGLSIGTEDAVLAVLPKEADASVAEAYEVAENAGLRLVPVSGNLYVNVDGQENRVTAVIENGVVYAQADNYSISLRENVEHEIFHERAELTPGLVDDLVKFLYEKYGREEVKRRLEAYYEDYQDLYGGTAQDAELEKWVLEELLADAYAEYNRYGAEELPGLSEKVQEEAWRDAEKTTDRTEGGLKFSYAGEQAATADMERLRRARELQRHGVDNETIRKETGWFQGMDGMWRFEIDDSQMQYRRAGDAQFRQDHPDYVRHQELMEKMLNGVISETEAQELQDLHSIWGREFGRLKERVDRNDATLGQVLEHPDLFAAYPQLKRVKVAFAELPDREKGFYRSASNEIVLSEKLKNAPEDDILHEIQHAIQKIEGFASGSSPEYWRKRMESGYDNRTHAELAHAENLQRQYDVMEAQDPEFMREAEELYASVPDMPRGEINWDTLEKIEDDPVEWQKFDARRDALEEKYGDKIFDFFALKENMKSARTGERMASDLYRDTAGEIEARNATKRRNLTAQQRAEIAPDYGNEDVVFAARAEDSFEYIGDTKDGRRCYRSGFDDSVSMDDRIAEFKNRIATIFNLGAVELKTDVKKIRVRGDRFTLQKNLYGDDVAEKGEMTAKINSLYDLADILSTAKYDPSATNKEDSYANPVIKPKNKAHEGVKYWYKFKNDIVFDGVSYKVTFNIRDKGSEQYEYLIEFKESKTPGLSNTAVNNLLRTDQVSYEDNIAMQPSTVKQKFSAESKKTEKEYMDAVNRGDMETAQRMVDDYAIKQGFEVDEDGAPDLLFHGTDTFGFTKPDTSKSDDQTTFWATPNMGVAGSYYKDSSYRVREIGKDKVTPRGKKLTYTNSMEEVVNAAKPFSAELGMDLSKVKYATEATVMKKAQKSMQKAALAAENVLRGDFPDSIKRIANRVLNASKQNTYGSWAKEINTETWKQYQKTTGIDFMDIDIDFLDDFNPNKSDISKVTQADPDVFKMMYYVGEVLDDLELGDTGKLKGETIVTQDIALPYNDLVSEKGIYGFYHKQNKPFVYDCDGSAWNKIEVPNEAKGYFSEETVTTRQLATWAFDNGYDAVKLDNVIDVGGYALAEARKPATVWAFKDPASQLKSADPVTYDDDGNVIPLEERFNTGEKDIRFSAYSEDRTRQKAERELARGIGEIMSMPKSAIRKLQDGLVHDLMEEYQTSGELNESKLSEIAANAYAQGLIVDDEFYQTYKHIKDALRTTAITISDADKSSIADFPLFRKKTFGTLKIVNEGGLPVDTFYKELHAEAPNLFPEDITHPADQLMKMYDVAKNIKKTETTLEKSYGEESDQFYEWAEGKIVQLVDRVLTKYADSIKWKPGAIKAQAPKQRAEIGSGDYIQPEVNADRQYQMGNLRKERERQENQDYIAPEERSGITWAGQYQVGNWEEENAPKPAATKRIEENLSEYEKARRGSAKEWAKYILSGERTAEEFARAMREAPSLQLKGAAINLADRLLESSKSKGDGENLWRDPEWTDEEYAILNERWKNRPSRQAQKPIQEMTVEELIIPKNAFTSTPAMEKLGIKIDGTVTRYRETDMLKGYHKAAEKTQRYLQKRINQLNASESEIYFARDIAKGTITPAMLNANEVDVKTVMELADYMAAAQSFDDDRLNKRREEINVMNTQLAKEMFADRETYTPKLPGKLEPVTKIVMNERTPERVLKQIFGEEMGGKLYETYFRPIWVNGAEMYRFENRMKQRVKEFTDSSGRTRMLTKEERAAAQLLLEGEAVRTRMEELEKDDPDAAERIKDAATNVNNGMGFLDAVREQNLQDKEELEGLVQAYADYMDTTEMVNTMDKTILWNAVREYQKIYNEFYDALNDFLVSHGYPPIGFIKGYAPHFQKKEVQQGLFGALTRLGVEKQSVTELPTSIAGRTADFKPNMKWNPHMQTRTGKKTDLDIQYGFERYLHYAAEIFYHTDDVMRLRRAVDWMRGQYAGEEIRQDIEDAQIDQHKSTAWKHEFLKKKEIIKPQDSFSNREIDEKYQKYVAELFQKADPETLQKYSEFVTWLDNYANVVAGKQSLADRGIEYGGGRTALNWGSKMMRTFAAANVAGNLSSVLNQSAQLPLLQTELGTYLEKAMLDMARGEIAKEHFADRSDFLTDKRGVEKLTMENGERVITVLFKPAELMDRMVSTLAVRGKYLQALDEGMTPEQAMKEADDFGRRVMGSRMRGARPAGFESKTLTAQMLHIFQTEASNTFDYMHLSDVPQAVKQVYKTKGKKAGARYVAAAVTSYLLNAFVLNLFANEIYGGSPAPFDLFGWILNFVASGWGLDDEEYVQTVVDNGWEQMFGERPFETERIEKEAQFQWAGAAKDLGYNVLGDIPYARNVMGIMGWGDQSMPTVGIGEAAEHIKNAGKAMIDEEGGIDWAGAPEAGMELLSAATQLVPLGRQIEKTAYGIKAMIEGGKFGGYGKNRKLQYPIERTPMNWIRAGLFGLSALDETDAFYAGGQALSVGQTEKMYELEDLGIDRFITYDLYQEFREINNELSGVEASIAKRNAINNLELTDGQKLDLFASLMMDQSSANYEKTYSEYQAMLDSGLSWDDITMAHNMHAMLDADEEMKATEKATEFAVWVDVKGWSEKQKETVESRFRFWNMMQAEAGNYTRFEDAGLSADTAKMATDVLAQLKPAAGKENVTTNQKVLALQKSSLAPKDKTNAIVALDPDRKNRFVEVGVPGEDATKMAAEIMIAEAENGEENLGYLQRARIVVDNSRLDAIAMDGLYTILDESVYTKLEVAVDNGLRPENWVLFKEEWLDRYGDDSVSQEKVENVLDRMNLTNQERAALWQIANKTWKPQNNPYNKDVAEEIYDRLN